VSSPAEEFRQTLYAVQEDVLRQFEHAIRMAFAAGHERALRTGESEPVETGYQDWRGWGPGHTLPGGSEYRRDLPPFNPYEVGIR
jgi:hypothetical protein